MGEQEPDERAPHAGHAVELQERDADDHGRHHQRRHQEGGDGFRARQHLAEQRVGGGHAEHTGKSPSSHADDCSCADSVGCECLCVFTIYPPATALLFAGAHPPVAADTPLPALVLPAGRLSRVFRPPIV